ncbi:UNVERIFIED_CONTAM: hypothetical protein Slati_2230500 [Sesamum latifolium]|uniref:Reverse transcriptase domain-containing protein n=1 Tax=Sesamum latifolium TaxID=2727402 RepID=A0AAW2WU48_9LAMI
MIEAYVDDMLVKSKKAKDHIADLEETFIVLRKYKLKLNPGKCAFGVLCGRFLMQGAQWNRRAIYPNRENDSWMVVTARRLPPTSYGAQALADFVLEMTGPPMENTLEKEVWLLYADGSATTQRSGEAVTPPP